MVFVAKRDNHYEAAFEEYLRSRCIPYVAVDEAKRSRWAGGSIKSLDFIVSPPDAAAWLDRLGVEAVLVRPDRYVFGSGAPGVLLNAWQASLNSRMPALAENAER